MNTEALNEHSQIYSIDKEHNSCGVIESQFYDSFTPNILTLLRKQLINILTLDHKVQLHIQEDFCKQSIAKKTLLHLLKEYENKREFYNQLRYMTNISAVTNFLVTHHIKYNTSTLLNQYHMLCPTSILVHVLILYFPWEIILMKENDFFIKQKTLISTM